ncbi:MAG TPA: ComEC/Rec2 family competence protein [Pyrinomonadaceae bacterium]|nr:ComEC/Rec2 family competence protein [Pyrinomonadaceae bacterium]
MPNSPTASNFNRHPLLTLGVYFACGILFGGYVGKPIAIATVVILCLGSFAIRSIAHAILPLCFIPLGILCCQFELNSISTDRIRRIYSEGRIQSGEPVEIGGVVGAFPEPTFDGQFLRVRVNYIRYAGADTRASGDVRLFAPGTDLSDLRYGDRVRVMCRLLREEQFQNPGVRSRVATLDEQGIDATGVIKSPLLVERLGSESVFVPLVWIHERRRSLIESFNQTFSPSTSGVLIASLLGDKHFLDRDTAEVFRDGGTFHVLVISGLHITFIGGLTFWIVSIFTRRQVWQCLLPAGFLWAYTLAVGAEIPVVRASLMFSLLLFGRLIHRSGSLLNALGGCVVVLLVWRPSDLFSASFQLTFVSVAAIVACGFPLVEKLRSIGSWTPSSETPFPPHVAPRLRRFCEALYWNEATWQIEQSKQTWSANLYKSPYLVTLTRTAVQSVAAYIFEGLLVSLIVQLWMLPFLVIYFHRVSPASLVLNLWVGVFIAIESFAAAFAVVTAALSPWLASPLVTVTEMSNSSMMWLPSVLSRMGWAGFRVPVYSGAGRITYLFYVLAVLVATFRLFRWRPFSLSVLRKSLFPYATGSLVMGLGLLIVLHPYTSPSPTGKLQIDFLDVGQGDAALVTFPTGETMLIDGGGQMSFSEKDKSNFEPDRMRIGEAVVSEFLWEKGHSRVDFVLATHSDADHIDGLIDVARNFEVGELLIGNSSGRETELRDELLRIAGENSVEVKLVSRGDRLIVGKVRVDFLNPAAGSSTSDNDSSLVTRISYDGRSFLMTGDIERRTEDELADEVLGSDIVKVAHHGSRTSSTQGFVDRTAPGFAVISVGRRSRFGHPHREVVERWIKGGAIVMTTGGNGTITIKTDGRTLEMSTFTAPP